MLENCESSFAVVITTVQTVLTTMIALFGSEALVVFAAKFDAMLPS